MVVTEPSAPEPDPAEQAPQQQPANPAKRPVEPRIGDADRDQAVNSLQEHMAQGRIDASEFDDRMARALKAKTASSSLSCSTICLSRGRHRPRAPRTRRRPGSNGTTLIRDSALAAHPGRQPGDRTPCASAVPQRSKADTVLAVMAAASWPAVILFCFATSWSYWWLIFIPIFISSIAGNMKQRRAARMTDSQTVRWGSSDRVASRPW